jgi:carboxymethylenebutenolidase
MSEKRIEAKVGDGVANGRLILASGDGPWPVVLMFPDAGGLRAAMSGMGERLAAGGYAVLQPNPFWRSEPFAPFDFATVWGNPTERQRLGALIGSMKVEQVMSDTLALLAEAGKDPRVHADRIGTIGYCMGGRLAFQSAERLPELVAAAAIIHGGGLVSDAPESPHRGVGTIRAEVYLAVADQDGSCTPEHQRVLREALDAAGVRYQMELYPAARHGFAVPDFPVFDAAAAEQHWQRVLALFGRVLKA